MIIKTKIILPSVIGDLSGFLLSYLGPLVFLLLNNFYLTFQSFDYERT